jgi:hypothetical protein
MAVYRTTLSSSINRLNLCSFARDVSCKPSCSSVNALQRSGLHQHKISNQYLARQFAVRLRLQARTISASTVLLSNERHQEAPIRVWEQTVSVSIAKPSTSTDEDEIKTHQGATYYQQTNQGLGWERMSTKSANESCTTSFLSELSSFKSKDMNNIQNIPFIHHFLPANYPHSVCASYTTYASYCFAGSIAGSAGMVLSTQALLLAVGVGTQSAAPMAAALNWVMKDGVGQLGGVIFASQLGKGGIDVGYWKSKLAKVMGGIKKSKGNFQTGTADSNPKRWRMVAATALDASTLLEICTPMMGPGWFLPCASVANIGKNVGFLAASASRAAVHQSLCMGASVSQSKSADSTDESLEANESNKDKLTNVMSFNNNLGDVTAKSGSQAIVASLLGTALGILLSQTFCADHGSTGILAGFIVLSAAHQVCTYKALRAVPLKSLDRHRLHICLADFIAKNKETILSGRHSDIRDEVLTPMEVSDRDFFLPLMPPDDSVNWLTIGAPLLEICPAGATELQSLLIRKREQKTSSHHHSDEYEKYILKYNPNDSTVLLTYLDGAGEDDVLKGMFHAYIARELGGCNENSPQIIFNAYSITIEQLPLFTEHLRRSGWEMGLGYVSVECGSSHRLGIHRATQHGSVS